MSLTALAEEITKHAKILDSYITTHNLPQPSFEADGPLDFPISSITGDDEESVQLQLSRTILLNACQALYNLTIGPAASVVSSAQNHPYELFMLSTLHHFAIPQAVPLEGGATMAEIAAKTGLEEDMVSRIIKYACSYRIFREIAAPDGNLVLHTAASRAFVLHDGLRNSLDICLDERFRDMASMLLINRSPREQTEKQSEEKLGVDDGDSRGSNSGLAAFNRAFQTDEKYHAYMRNPEHRSVLLAMNGFLDYVMGATNMGGRNHDMDMLANGAIDWDSLGEALVVDVGGGHGNVSVSIAEKHPKLRFIVQDLPTVVSNGKKKIYSTAQRDPRVASRISFMAQDMFKPQPPQINADIFMFRFVINDWPDESAVKILQNLLPAMRNKTGCRVMVMDCLLPEAGAELSIVERLERTMDFSALAIHKGKERSVQDWRQLIGKVDSKLEIVQVYTKAHNAFGIIELALKGGASKISKTDTDETYTIFEKSLIVHWPYWRWGPHLWAPIAQIPETNDVQFEPLQTDKNRPPQLRIPSSIDVTDPYQISSLIFTESLWRVLADNTNLYAYTKESKNHNLHHRSWHPTTPEELKFHISAPPEVPGGFISTFYPPEPTPEQELRMSEEQLSRIWWHKVHIVLDMLRRASKNLDIPSANISIDEAIVRSHGRSSHTFKLPNKSISQGFKIFVLADHGYVYYFYPASRTQGVIEVGKVTSLTKTGQMVYELIQTLPRDSYNYNVYLDNYFTSIDLFKMLRDIQVGACGTTRAISAGKDFPDLLKKLKDLSNYIPYHKLYAIPVRDVLCVAWQDNNIVLALSTIHTVNKTEDYVERERRRPQKTSTNGPLVHREFGVQAVKNMLIPRLIDDYNYYMGGVDIANQHRAAYETHTKTFRSWWPLWNWCLDVDIINASKLHSLRCKELGIASLSHVQFRRRLSKQLLSFRPLSTVYQMKPMKRKTEDLQLPEHILLYGVI
ncbi:O-methyltransferase, putative [Talaromyces stipitatus ATCC 10500]|uniref:O-methyltransferase, putative n=1 Tax=Talaromyces stipitatus (strain ATCC 10500 / CBS 375.48 / QM 6759 / NRRL 1006) TaxID=441959 RepID=B8MSK2_TALSN|nr:O-methyltransferase, putative [Talaromyces stipitatus ATCC 10500]EED12082.1 O-methyltransferase, putative [Talaromyces stipitatus ATCC 10500]